MALYLLGTNIISDAIRNTQGACATRIGQAAPEDLCTSIIVAAELRFGAEKKGSRELTERIERALSGLSVKTLGADADHCYGKLRADLERRGQLIGANDMLIAAHALVMDAILVTDNVAEFSRVHGLTV